jgi:hypothetical protein
MMTQGILAFQWQIEKIESALASFVDLATLLLSISSGQFHLIPAPILCKIQAIHLIEQGTSCSAGIMNAC